MSEETPDQPPEELPDFETALSQLEGIIERIESGEVGLEESLSQYEHGVKLIRQCRGILDRAEQKIEQLTQEADGSLRSEDADVSSGGDEASSS